MNMRKQRLYRVRSDGTREAIHGTCPHCGRVYEIVANGRLRKHGEGDCFLAKQVPAEIIPAIRMIASL